MSLELSVSQSLDFSKNGSSFSAASRGARISVSGDNAIKQTLSVDQAGTTLDKGAVGTIGYCLIKNLAVEGTPPDPAVVTVTTHGTPGSTTRSYVVVANYADGSKSVSDPYTITTSNATLDTSNWDIVAFTDVDAATYDVYRTDVMPTAIYIIKTNAGASPYLDKGALEGSATIPTAIAGDQSIEYCSDGSAWDYALKAGESASFRFNETNIHVHTVGPPVEVEATLIDD